MGATMETTLQDHGGTLFEVQYTWGSDNVPEIASLRVLDADYRPAGPNLAPFLDTMLIMVAPGEATPFLSLVSEQIHDSRGIAPGCEAV